MVGVGEQLQCAEDEDDEVQVVEAVVPNTSMEIEPGTPVLVTLTNMTVYEAVTPPMEEPNVETRCAVPVLQMLPPQVVPEEHNVKAGSAVSVIQVPPPQATPLNLSLKNESYACGQDVLTEKDLIMLQINNCFNDI